MAQNRINKAGSIFTRLDGLIKANLIPWNERPIWYDVYKAFPPQRDPTYRSVLGKQPIPELPPKIFYQQDELRAYYFKNISPIETVVLNSNMLKPIWELFIETYFKLAKRGISKENLIMASIEELKKSGHFIELKKEKTPRNILALLSGSQVELEKEKLRDNKNEQTNAQIDQNVNTPQIESLKTDTQKATNI